MGGYIRAGEQHSQCLENWFVHIPGLKIIVPSTPYDAKGMIKTAINDPDPVVSATALNRGVEACVRAVPEQYLWSYKRFKSRPWGGWLVYDERPPIELSFEG